MQRISNDEKEIFHRQNTSHFHSVHYYLRQTNGQTLPNNHVYNNDVSTINWLLVQENTAIYLKEQIPFCQ